MSEPSGELTNKPFAAQLSNVYFSILALFCFKLFVKISLNLLAYFYIVRGNRKEAARISAEFYDYGQQHSKYSDDGGDIQDRSLLCLLVCLSPLHHVQWKHVWGLCIYDSNTGFPASIWGHIGYLSQL